MPSCPSIETASPNDRTGRRSLRAWMLAGAVMLALGGCSARMPSAYTPPLQQGNVIEQESLSRLKPGMTRSQVRFLLGTPLVVDVFRNDRWDYVYFLRRQGQPPQQRRVTVIFDGDQLARIEGDVLPGSGTVVPSPAAKADAARAEAAKADAARAEAAKAEAARSAAGAGADKAPAAAAPLAPPAPAKADAPKAEPVNPGSDAPQRGFFGRMLDRIGF
jgi:outer membrane protein assembly factor BamE